MARVNLQRRAAIGDAKRASGNPSIPRAEHLGFVLAKERRKEGSRLR